MITRLAIAALCVLGAVAALAWLAVTAITGSPRFMRIAIGIDQAANAAFGGDEDRTISTRAGIARSRGRRWGCLLCWLLDRIDPGHCDSAVRNDV